MPLPQETLQGDQGPLEHGVMVVECVQGGLGQDRLHGIQLCDQVRQFETSEGEVQQKHLKHVVRMLRSVNKINWKKFKFY